MNALTPDVAGLHIPKKPERVRVMTVYQAGFILLLLCWLLLMLWPCLTQEMVYISRADNAVMTLMAAVILAAARIAIMARDRLHAVLFLLAELLYCSTY